MLPSLFVAASAAILLVLGLAHLLFTFRGRKLHPRDPALKARMQEVAPGLTRETTMWRCWIGFNASHSFGALLFALVYGYLALWHASFLFASWFLLGTGLALLAGYVVLGRLYWFSVPFRGIVAATGLYVLGLVVRFA
ncbi:MAG TPA: hypothetical protein VLJ57_17670 [Burkholderiaceae bacterium]|nr:hypothetical protein [Burkholderiaceae bacterium]